MHAVVGPFHCSYDFFIGDENDDNGAKGDIKLRNAS
jgi:hypothetical protein